ncbi:MAG TPA: alpha/beta fold hydrolase [Actinomycetes bacterium]|nr:alpha/beta fold hydrolase [Actinomycetes bacterium]
MRQRRSRFVPALLLAAAISVVGLAPGVAGAQEDAALTVGRLRLTPCADLEGAWCGQLQVPYDRADPAAGTIRINLEWYPAEQSPAGTIVAMEGGPGYPSTGSRDSYLELFAPLQDTRNLLLVDNRGSSTSGLVDCRPLQRWHLALGNDEYVRRVAQCGDQLDSTRPRPGAGFVRGSDRYGTADAARDLADVLAALETGPVDLYGDSYGGYFGQTFAARHPELLRSLTLDATWPVLGTDPFYVSTIETARSAFDLTCRRSVACALAAPGSSMARIGALAERLRRAPIVGQTREPGGAPSTWRVDVGVLVALVNNAGADAGVYRELDAAAREVLEHDDAVPLLRLAATSLYTDDGGPVREWSAGLYAAVSCTDYPQAFDMGAPPALRRAQYAAALDALPGDVFAPFTVGEWTTSPVAEFDACLGWPSPLHHDPPIATSPPLVPPTLPVLVLSGGLDTLTPWTDGAVVAAQLGPSARWVKVENTVHVTALGDPHGCASGLVRRFVRQPGQLQSMDVSCAAAIPEVRVVGKFPRRLAGATPAVPRPGNRAGSAGLRLAAVGAAAVGDAIAQWWYLPGSRGHGLRGGTFTVEGDEVVQLTLRRARFVADAVVDGQATWSTTTGTVTAQVVVTGPGRATATLRMRWDDLARHPRAIVTGQTGSGDRLVATLPAP